MKIITIGRSENSHIFIDHPLVSRQHALLKIYGNGKMVIVDKSSNGTSVNGSPIKKERETPVSRRDVVTFAGVSQLDWKEVPDPLKVFKIIGIALASIVLALGLFFGIKALLPEKEVKLEPETTIKPPVYTPEPKQENQEADKPASKEMDADLELEKWKRENKQPTEKPTNRQPSRKTKTKTEQPKTQETKSAESEKPQQETSESTGNPILF
ncbi:MAG: FHA domain-containing protein [Bacteroidales bacterium]|nr:FHA domain-containing protein [Bacteroidales bacterium]